VIGRRIKALREAKGWSQDDLARRAKLTKPYVSMLETGERKQPSLPALRRLAKVLDEAGVFVVPEKRERYVCCHVALLIPSSQAELVLYEFLRLRDLWGRTQIELKGSSLDEAQIAAVVELLLKFDVIVRVVAIDMAEHTEAAVTQFKEAQAAAVTKNLTLEHKPGLVKQMEELRD